MIPTVINNSILIVYQALHYLRDGMTTHDAVRESVRVRVRPILMSTTMVPILLALFTKSPKKPLAGLLSASFGFAGVVIFYPVVQYYGVHNAQFGTYIWDFEISGNPVSIWQEYCIFFTMPLSLIGYFLGNAVGRKPPRIQPVGVDE